MHALFGAQVCAIACCPALTLETDGRDAPCSSRSAQILEPILTAQMKAHPAWASWLKLVELFTYTLQMELKVDDVKVIDNLQLQHSHNKTTNFVTMLVTRSGVGNELLTLLPTPDVSRSLLTFVMVGLSVQIDYSNYSQLIFTRTANRHASMRELTALTNTA